MLVVLTGPIVGNTAPTDPHLVFTVVMSLLEPLMDGEGGRGGGLLFCVYCIKKYSCYTLRMAGPTEPACGNEPWW